jgi:hypothetical protein
VTYGTISSPLIIKDSGNKCCDEVTVIYDYHDEDTKKAERIRIKYWTEPHISNKGARHRLFKQKDILGQNKKILAKPILGKKDVMADYIEDLQIVNIINDGLLYSGFHQTNNGIDVYDIKNNKSLGGFSFGTISALAFGSDGLLYSGHEGGYYVGIYDTYAKKNIGGFSVRERVSALAFDSNSLLYIGHKGSRGVYVYNIDNKKLIQYLGKIGSDTVSTLAFGSDGLLYSGSEGSSYIVSHNVKTKKTEAYMRTNNSNRVSALAFKDSKTGQESLITINLTLRTKNQYGKDRQFKKKDYHGGNFKIDKTDKYKRDTFSSTVLIRNLAL